MELNNEIQKITPAVRLGNRIRRLREERGLSLRQLCEQEGLGPISHTYIGRVELGKQLPSEDLVTKLDKFFNADGVLIEFWEMANEEVIPDFARKVVSKEPDAVRIQVSTGSNIPALLQTKEYTEAAFRRALHDASEERLSDLVAARVRRQKILRREDPPYYWAIMDECALKRPAGSAGIMINQLRHLLKLINPPHVVVQVFPFSAGIHPMGGGSLTLHSLSNGGMIAGVEGFDSGESVESPIKLAALSHRFDLACSLALTPQQSLDLIREYLREYENEHHS